MGLAGGSGAWFGWFRPAGPVPGLVSFGRRGRCLVRVVSAAGPVPGAGGLLRGAGVPGVLAGGVAGVTGWFLGVRGVLGALEKGCFGPLRRGFGGGRGPICAGGRRRVLFSELPG